ncbi:MAG: hypothetical protein WD185_03725 [Sneathiella sp.]
MTKGVDVDLEDVWIRFGDFVAVREANVNIRAANSFRSWGHRDAVRRPSCVPYPVFWSQARAR